MRMTNQEAIEKLVNAEFADKYQGDQDLTTAMHMAIDALESGPARRGRWIDAREQCGSYVCSKCDYQSIAQYNFCPHCGAKMDGGAENG